MIPHVTDARYVRDYTVWLKFNDGAEGYVNLGDELYGEMFSPLKDLTLFRSVHVDPELARITWDNGADFAPEFLHGRLPVPVRPDEDTE